MKGSIHFLRNRMLTYFLSLGCTPIFMNCRMEHQENISEKWARESLTPNEADTLFDAAELENLYGHYKTISHWDDSKQDSIHIEDRRPHIQRFPCSQCHTASAKVLGERNAHFGIGLNHANANTMNCATCHGLKMDQDSLTSLTGKSIAFEKSFELCGQCHSRQLSDFVGGAHGKRLGGWGGTRIVRNCTGCHNPHDPNWKTRWPATSATRRGEP